MCSVQCAMCSLQCSVCSVQCSVCTVQCAVCCLQLSVCSVLGIYLAKKHRSKSLHNKSTTVDKFISYSILGRKPNISFRYFSRFCPPFPSTNITKKYLADLVVVISVIVSLIRWSFSSRGFKIESLVQNWRWFCWRGGFCLFMELHREVFARSLPSRLVLRKDIPVWKKEILIICLLVGFILDFFKISVMPIIWEPYI